MRYLGAEAHDECADEQGEVAQPDVQQRVQAAARQQPHDEPHHGADQEHGDREPGDSLIHRSLAGHAWTGSQSQDYLSGGGW